MLLFLLFCLIPWQASCKSQISVKDLANLIHFIPDILDQGILIDFICVDGDIIDEKDFAPLWSLKANYNILISYDGFTENCLKHSSDESQAVVLLDDVEKVVDDGLGELPHHMIVIVFLTEEDKDPTKLIDASKIKLNLESRLFSMVHQGNDSAMVVREHYRIHDSYPIESQLLGELLPDSGVVWRTSRSIWERRKNLRGLKLQAGLHFGVPMATKYLGHGLYTGYFVEVFETLAHTLNFTFSYKKSRDALHGNLDDDGNFNGLVGMLQRDEIDVIVSDLTISDARAKVCDFTFPLMEEKYRLLVKRPEHVVEWFNYLKIYSFQFWASSFLLAIVLGIFFLLIVKLLKTHSTLGSVFKFVFVAMINREFDSKLPERNHFWSSRILMLSTLFWGFIFFAAYNAVLISSLAVTEPPLPYQSMLDLVHDSEGRLALAEGAFYVDLFRFGDPESVYRQLYDKFISNDAGSFFSESSAFHNGSHLHPERKRVLDEGYAVIVATSVLRQYSEYPCEILDIPHDFFEGKISFALKKGSPLLSLFNFHLKKMDESGLLDGLKDRFYSIVKDKDMDCNRELVKNLGFKETLLVFAIVVVGIVLGSIMALFEKMLVLLDL